MKLSFISKSQHCQHLHNQHNINLILLYTVLILSLNNPIVSCQYFQQQLAHTYSNNIRRQTKEDVLMTEYNDLSKDKNNQHGKIQEVVVNNEINNGGTVLEQGKHQEEIGEQIDRNKNYQDVQDENSRKQKRQVARLSNQYQKETKRNIKQQQFNNIKPNQKSKEKQQQYLNQQKAQHDKSQMSLIVQQQKLIKKIKVHGFNIPQKQKTKVAAVIVPTQYPYNIYPQPATYAYPYQPTYPPYQPPYQPAYPPYPTYPTYPGYPSYQYPAYPPGYPVPAYSYPPIYPQQPVYYQPVVQQPVIQPGVQPVVQPVQTIVQPAPASQPASQPIAQDSLSAIINSIIKPATSSNPTVTTTTTTNPNTNSTTTTSSSTTITITPSTTPQSLNNLITNNIINNIFNNLIPKTDPNFYNTGPGQKVYQLKNISLNINNVGTGTVIVPDSNTVNNTGSVPAGNVSGLISNPKPNNTVLIPQDGSVLPLRSSATDLIASTTTTASNAVNITSGSITNTGIPIINGLRVPVVNGTITGTSVATAPTTVNSGTNLKYQQYLIKFKPNLITQNPNDISVYRQTIFNLNINNINTINAQPNNTYKVGVNLFADLTQDQFNRQFAKLVVPDDIRSQAAAQITLLKNQNKTILTLPPAINIDWSCKSSVVISQGVCGACYTISALQSIQITMRAYNKTVDFLSIQQVISCGATSRDNNGCLGGYFSGTYNYMQQFGVGQSPLYFYDDRAKFQGVLSQCNTTLIKSAQYTRKRVFIKQSKRIRFGDCAELVNQLKFRSIAVGIAAFGFQFYVDGTFSTDNKYVNHGVTLVGYDAKNGYLIKNSWGVSWGKKGYGFIDQSTGVCSYAMYAVTMDQTFTPVPCNNGQSIGPDSLITSPNQPPQ